MKDHAICLEEVMCETVRCRSTDAPAMPKKGEGETSEPVGTARG
jgi:hypothetical protein